MVAVMHGQCPVHSQTRTPTSAVLLLVACVLSLIHARAMAQEQPGASEFVKEARNPLADQISVQAQPNFNFGGAPDRDTQYVYNLQSVVPIHFAGAWTLFARAILPLIDQPGSEPGQGYTFGIGDIQPTLIFSPPSSKSFIWGFGSVFQFPSASSTSLGTGKCEIGPTAAAVLTGSWWQLGGQVNNLWSFAGDASRPAGEHDAAAAAGQSLLARRLVPHLQPADDGELVGELGQAVDRADRRRDRQRIHDRATGRHCAGRSLLQRGAAGGEPNLERPGDRPVRVPAVIVLSAWTERQEGALPA